MLNPGDALGGRYRLDEPIASGGMGEVWRATDQVLGRTVAVKVLHPRAVSDPGFSARFRGEARTMATLRHPGVVDVYDYGEGTDTEGKPVAYLVMAYVDGEALSTRIKAAERLSPAETMAVVAQTAHALQAAHDAGVIHRDVKPGNLIVRPDGQVVLVDFGVARSAEAASLTGVNELVGTALYMAPEQVAKRTITPATDIYALGAVAYHCLAGHPPFVGDNALTIALSHLDDEPPPLPEDVPPAVRAVVATAMAKDPADRFSNAAAMAQIAEAALGPDAGETTASLTRTGTTALLAAGAATRPRPGYAAGADRFSDTLEGEPIPPGTAAGGGRRPLSGRRRAGVVAAVVLGVAALVALVAFMSPDGREPVDTGPVPSAPASLTPEAEQSETVRPSPSAGSPTRPRNPGPTRSAGASPSATGAPTSTPSATAEPTKPPVTTEPTTPPVTDPPTGGPTAGPGPRQ